ncbi:Crp/Fnr family transcriptional regulator [Vibrio maerlii]|uniref:Crp/Fnr family transcriptional regulator n=1 Tax=Vibrio maerlii TaxID=2231648 RepID=UPI000E3E6007|nr:Crp/Fnr family transcriptional regulator [Vibrio maerlii]
MQQNNLKVDDIVWPCELDTNVKQSLLAIAEHRYGPKDRKVEEQYAFQRGIYYYLQGSAAVCFYVTEPEKTIGTIHGKGDWMGVNSVGTQYKVVSNIEVIQEVELVFFPEMKLLDLAEREPQIYKLLFTASRDVHKIWLQSFLAFAHHNVLQVSYILLDIYNKGGVDGNPSKDIRISQQQLSFVVGCTRSKLNALLKDMEKRGYIKLGRNKITLVNLELLNAEVSRMNLMVKDPRADLQLDFDSHRQS